METEIISPLPVYRFRHRNWQHQDEALRRSWQREAFALFMEQGTGKTKVIIDTAGMLYGAGHIDALVVIAPNGVQRAWVKDELPKHISPGVPCVAAWWTNHPTKAQSAALEALWDPRFIGLRVLTVNYETLITKKAYTEIRKFLHAHRCLLVADESHKCKDASAKRTQAVLQLSIHAPYRRILTGTPATKSPLNLFSQFRFLDEEILGIRSYTAFKAHYAVLEDPHDSGLLRHISQRLEQRYGSRAAANARLPQIVSRDANGQPIYRNLDELNRLIEPHSYRVLKRECLDLPPKVYTRRYVELDPEQRRLYRELRDEFLTEYAGTMMPAPLAITRLTRLQQIVGGFFKADADTPSVPIGNRNPKLEDLLSVVEEDDAKYIIWARFVDELRLIADTLEHEYDKGSVARYWGEVKGATRRDQEKKNFITKPGCRFFVAQVQAGGTGLDGLQVADRMIYFSNDFSLEARLQSEDRAHRGGSEVHDQVTIIDIQAEDSIDQKIIDTLRANKDMADVIIGDDPSLWL